jgi:nitrous oxidase accessory protein
MPIEDADKVHSRRGEKPTINILGFKVPFMTFMITLGVGIGAIFILIAGVMMMNPPQVAPVIIIEPPKIDSTNITFDVITTNYNYRIIKMTYSGGRSVSNFPSEILLSVYPPPSNYYVQRQAVQNNNVTMFNIQYNTIYMYTGIDNIFHISYDIPKYSDCVDFISGDWSLNADDNLIKRNMYKFNFNISNSKTMIIEGGSSISDSIKILPEYSTLFIYSGLYKEKIILSKPVRIIGINNPVINAGGSGSDITIQSSNNVISGLTITNSGNKEFMEGGIVITPGNTGNIITKNTIYQTVHGIWIYRSGLNTITYNTIRNADKNGIMMISSSSNTIIKNTLYNNIDGIRADAQSDLNTINENNVYDNLGYGIIIDNYASLNNICEYNIYKTNKMSCSNSVDRDQTPIIRTTVPTVRITPVTTSNDWWSDCGGNPKCYQS